jgi:hypothetical protein
MLNLIQNFFSIFANKPYYVRVYLVFKLILKPIFNLIFFSLRWVNKNCPSMTFIILLIREITVEMIFAICPEGTTVLAACWMCMWVVHYAPMDTPPMPDSGTLAHWGLAQYYKGPHYPHQLLLNAMNNELTQYFVHEVKPIDERKATSLLAAIKAAEEQLEECNKSKSKA